MTRMDLIARIASEIEGRAANRPTRVCVDGIDTAGKTTFANELGKLLERQGHKVIRASIDGFHHPRERRTRKGEFSPEGYFADSFDYQSLDELLLSPLGPGGDRHFRLRAFNYRTDKRDDSEWQVASDDSILVMDGVFMLRTELAGLWDYSIYLRISFEECLNRALVRDLELFRDEALLRRKYSERYMPGQRIYLDRDKPETRASIVVDNEDFEAPLILDCQ